MTQDGPDTIARCRKSSVVGFNAGTLPLLWIQGVTEMYVS
jgi:hypothetical protein